ncbi:tudor domain-containing protein 3 [Homalodisca vitripennis]|nr:tudor domain-containing protein 3 [Homalodisca vitripennis]
MADHGRFDELTVVTRKQTNPHGQGIISEVIEMACDDPSFPIQNSDHAMLARCAALCAACSFRKKINSSLQSPSPDHAMTAYTHKTQTELTQVSLQAKDKRRAFITDKIRRLYTFQLKLSRSGSSLTANVEILGCKGNSIDRFLLASTRVCQPSASFDWRGCFRAGLLFFRGDITMRLVWLLLLPHNLTHPYPVTPESALRHLSNEAIQRISDNGAITNVRTLHNKALDLDLREISVPFFPEDIAKGKLEVVPGNVIVQVQKVRNISAPKANEDSQAAPRMLKIVLTDGHTVCHAIEVETVSVLSLNSPPGTKVLLKGESLAMSHGLLLLRPGGVQVLGGRVTALIDKWELNRSLAKHTRGRIGEEGGPPPWIPFGQKILRPNLQDRNFKIGSF